jgi:hypothetical protein
MRDVTTSRDLNTLHPDFRPLADKFLDACRRFGLDTLVYCTTRSMADQAREFRKGRKIEDIETMSLALGTIYERPDLAQILIDVGPQSGNVITTKAGPGMSLHNYGYALDACPLDAGRYPKNDSPLWDKYARVAEECGLMTIRWDRPHCQMAGVKWQDLINKT